MDEVLGVAVPQQALASSARPNISAAMLYSKGFRGGALMMDALEPYEQFYYGHQVKGRGVMEPKALEARCRAQLRTYDELFGPAIQHLCNAPALDVGCGYGNLLYYLRERGWENPRGIDLDPAQVALAQQLGWMRRWRMLGRF